MSHRLSLLDKSPLPPGGDAVAALAATVQFAQLAERLGYHRFWVAEHHASALLAGAAPEILAAHLLALTSHIRIGTGGVMLQHYSPYKVAEVFRVLSSLAPGRVDLGVGKAPGGLPLATRALQSRHDAARPADLPALLAELDEHLSNEPREGRAPVAPQPPQPPERFLLGASPESARLAARQGWTFVYAGHFNGDPEAFERTLRVYDGLTGRVPLLAVYAFAADSETLAARAVGELKIYRVELPDGQAVNLPTLAAAAEFARQGGYADYRAQERRPQVLSGTGAFVRGELDALAARWGIEEFVIDTPVPDPALRRRSIELLAAAATDR